MKKIVLLFSIVILLTSLSAQVSQKDYAKELKKDVIEIVDHQYVYSSYCLLKNLNSDETLQCKFYSTAPKSLISRDNFIMFSTAIFSMVACGALLTDEGVANNENIKIVELDEPIGEVGASIQIFMTKNGLQVKIASGMYNEMLTLTWEDLMGD